MFRLVIFFLLCPNLVFAQAGWSTNDYDNLWSIAIELKKEIPDYSVYQIMISLQSLNPEAFREANVNFLKKGQFLISPDSNSLAMTDKTESVRSIAEQNFKINSNYTDYLALQNVLILTEPDFSLAGEITEVSDLIEDDSLSLEDNEMIAEKKETFADSEETDLQKELLEASPEQNYIDLTSDLGSEIQEDLSDIQSGNSLDYQLIVIIALVIVLAILGISYFRNAPKNDNLSNTSLSIEEDEGLEEIGNPNEARLNLATMYFEMKEFDKARELAEEIIQNSDDDYIVSKAKQLLENFNGS